MRGFSKKMTENLNKLDLVSDISQLISLFLLLRDASNNAIMDELQRQNKEYLETIIKRLDRIERKLNDTRITRLPE